MAATLQTEVLLIPIWVLIMVLMFVLTRQLLSKSVPLSWGQLVLVFLKQLRLVHLDMWEWTTICP